MRIALARGVLVGLFTCAAAACGSVATGPDAADDGGDDGPAPDDGALSGTRLKLKWVDFGGTRVGGYSAHDTTAGFDCSPRQWDDDRFYCTPSTGSIVYTNATCTSPVAYSYHSPTCPTDPPDFFLEYAVDACIGYRVKKVYRRGALAAQADYYQLASDGSCNGPYTDSNVDFYAVGTQLGRGELAELTRVAGEPGDRYAQQFYASADGARMFDRFVDNQLGTGCYLETFGDGTAARCVPDTSSYAGYFSDATCTTPATSAASACEAPDYLVQYPTSVCTEGNRPRYFTAGAAASPVYSGGATSCNELGSQPGTTYYAAGSELSFPTLTRTIDSDGGRQIQLSHYADGALQLRGGGQFDTVHDIRCYIAGGDAGQYQCVPYEGSISTYYADAACTTTIDVMDVYRGDASCDPPPVPPVATRFVGGCPETFELFAAGALYGDPLYYNPGDGTCLQDQNTAYLHYRLGASIPLSELATGVDVVDP